MGREKMSLVVPPNFQHILRVMNTNIEGKTNVMFAMTAIKGVGRRYANIVLKKADIPMGKRAGELSEEDVEKIVTIMQNPRQYKIPDWFLNRQRGIKDGKTSQVMANLLDNKLREDLQIGSLTDRGASRMARLPRSWLTCWTTSSVRTS